METATGQHVARPLNDLISEIEQRGGKADDDALVAARLIAEVCKRVEAGEIGQSVKWFEWALKAIKLSQTRLYELDAIGKARDPRAELERYRRINRERQKRFQAARRESDPERLHIIKWAKIAPIVQIRTVRKHIAALPS